MDRDARAKVRSPLDHGLGELGVTVACRGERSFAVSFHGAVRRDPYQSRF